MPVTQSQPDQFAAIKVELGDTVPPHTYSFKPLKQSTIAALYSKVEGKSFHVSGTSYKPFWDAP